MPLLKVKHNKVFNIRLPILFWRWAVLRKFETTETEIRATRRPKLSQSSDTTSLRPKTGHDSILHSLVHSTSQFWNKYHNATQTRNSRLLNFAVVLLTATTSLIGLLTYGKMCFSCLNTTPLRLRYFYHFVACNMQSNLKNYFHFGISTVSWFRNILVYFSTYTSCSVTTWKQSFRRSNIYTLFKVFFEDSIDAKMQKRISDCQLQASKS